MYQESGNQTKLVLIDRLLLGVITNAGSASYTNAIFGRM